ncbi:MAG: GFA family protein [Gaiellales bacterium]
MSVSGGCLCGSVRFELEPPLRNILVCHCSLCRRAGTLAGAYTAVPIERLRLLSEGGLRWYVDRNERRRGFCQECGSTLFWQAGSQSISISAGALDEPGELRVAEHIFTGSAALWESIPPDAPHRR